MIRARKGTFRLALGQAAAILLAASVLGLGVGWLRGTLSLGPQAKVPPVGPAPTQVGREAAPTAPAPQPHHPAIAELPLGDARSLIQAGAIVLDARRPEDFALGHLPGAVNLPVEEFDNCFAEVEPRLNPQVPLLVYCGGGDCTLSHELADVLRQMGYARVEVLQGGLEAWKAAGLGVER